MRIIFILFILSISVARDPLLAQENKKSTNLVFVDKEGVLTLTKNNTEASFFLVNYTVPFAYSYRAHKMPHIDMIWRKLK